MLAALRGGGGGALTAEEKTEARLDRIREANNTFLVSGVPLEKWPGPNRALYKKEQEQDYEI